MESDLKKIKEKAKEKEDENWMFRLFLKGYENDFVFRLIGVIQNYSICPIVFNVYEALKHRLRSEFIDFQEEIDERDYD